MKCSSLFLIKEGIEDWREQQEIRANLERDAQNEGCSVGDLFAHQRVRKRARALGLAYWPALAYGPKIDPSAYLAAERVLASKTGGVYGETLPDGSRHRGGWDSWGHYGLSAENIAQMWYAAGCRDGGKFRLQVASGVIAKKGDTLPFVKNYVRGARWLSANRLWLRLPHLSRKAIATLGRLSPELRRAAITDVAGDKKIRVRDLNWSRVARAQKMLATSGNIRVRAAMAGMRRAAVLLDVCPSRENVAAALAPAYPRLPLTLARRLALGESPVQLADGQLTRREAHEWALAGAPEIGTWLAERLDVPTHRSVRVIRWLAHCRQTGRWDAIERDRIARIPGGETRRYSALSVLDEIQDDDIVIGTDSVDAVLQRSAQRLGEAWLTAQMSDHRVLAPLPSFAKNLPRGTRILRTPADLARESIEMSHCVGGYRDAVERGQCHILAIASRAGRSTVELSPTTLAVVQHRGPSNSVPPAKHEKLLRAWLARIAHQREGVRHVS